MVGPVLYLYFLVGVTCFVCQATCDLDADGSLMFARSLFWPYPLLRFLARGIYPMLKEGWK